MHTIERQMMRRLHGELSEAELRDFDRHLAAEPDWRARYRELERVWKGLEEPPSVPLDLAFTARVMRAARRQARGELSWAELSWAAAPPWARTGAALALTVGLALGMTLAEIESAPVEVSTVPIAMMVEETALEGELFAEPLSLSEIWWRSVEDGSFGEGELLDRGGQG